MRRAGFILALVLSVLLAGEARADTIQLRDGRFFSFPKVFQTEKGYRIPFTHGEVFLPRSLVLDATILGAGGKYTPRNPEEKAKVEKGLLPHRGKWITKAKWEQAQKDMAQEAEKRLVEKKKHLLWRNRYISRTPHFQFEYTIDPAIYDNYANLMEAYYKVFAKKFRLRPYRNPKTKGRLKVCFYHDDEYYYQVSGAPRGAIGYFRFVEPIELNFFYDRTDEYLTMGVLFHECNHFLVHLINPAFVFPAWLAEGMAEYYGASEWDPKSKKLTTGLLQEGRTVVLMDAIAGNEWLKLEEMIRLKNFGALHYAWGWSFVHMIMESKKYSKPFLRYFMHLPTGKNVKRTEYGFNKYTVDAGEQIRLFKAFMKTDMKKLEKRWHDYVRNLKVESGRGYALAGDWAMRWGLRFRAIRYFKTSLEKGAVTALTYDKLGKLLEDKKKIDEALDAYRKAVELAPLTPRYTMHLGNALYDKGGEANEKEGRRLMRLALEIDPEDVHLKQEARDPELRKR